MATFKELDFWCNFYGLVICKECKSYWCICKKAIEGESPRFDGWQKLIGDFIDNYFPPKNIKSYSYIKNNTYFIEFILPKISKENISVTILGYHLTIKYKQLNTATYETLIEVLPNIFNDTDNIKAELKNGILIISVPQKDAKQINIQID